MTQIKWKTIEVEITKIKPTPNNYKIKTEDGAARFKTSVDNFGLAGSVIINSDYTLIDGNTRLEKAKEMGMEKIFASMPSRKLTPKEFTEFAAMYDYAKAGDVDVQGIKNDLGSIEGFFKKWGMELPPAALKRASEMVEEDTKVPGAKKQKAKKEVPVIQTRQIMLAYSADEAEEVISIAQKNFEKYKVDNMSDLILKVFREL